MALNFNWVGKRKRFNVGKGFSLGEARRDIVEELAKSYYGILSQLGSLNCALPPVDPYLLLGLASRRNGYHGACIHTKKSLIVGKGYDGDPELLAWLDAIETEEGLYWLLLSAATDMETFGYTPLEVRGGIGKWALYNMPAAKTRVVLPTVDTNGRPVTPLQYLQYEYVSRDIDGKGDVLSFAPTYFDKFSGVASKGPGALGGVYMMRLPSITGNRWYGEPEYFSALDLLAMNVSIVEHGKRLFSQGMMADFLLVGEGTNLSTKKIQRLRESIRTTLVGLANAHKIGFVQVGEGEKLTKLDLNATLDRSFSETRDDNRDEIISSHLLTPRIVGVVAAGSLGGGGEAEGQLTVTKNVLVDPRQTLYESQFQRLFRMMGAPKPESFRLKPMQVVTNANDPATLAQGIQAGFLSAQEAHDEWAMEKSAGGLVRMLRKMRDEVSADAGRSNG